MIPNIGRECGGICISPDVAYCDFLPLAFAFLIALQLLDSICFESIWTMSQAATALTRRVGKWFTESELRMICSTPSRFKRMNSLLPGNYSPAAGPISKKCYADVLQCDGTHASPA